MSTNDESLALVDKQTPLVSPGNYSPVTVYNKDLMGVLFLGLLDLILLIGWMRSEARCRALMSKTEANPDTARQL